MDEVVARAAHAEEVVQTVRVGAATSGEVVDLLAASRAAVVVDSGLAPSPCPLEHLSTPLLVDRVSLTPLRGHRLEGLAGTGIDTQRRSGRARGGTTDAGALERGVPLQRGPLHEATASWSGHFRALCCASVDTSTR